MTASLPPPADPAVNEGRSFYEAWWRFFRELLNAVNTLVSDLAADAAALVTLAARVTVLEADAWITVFKLADQTKTADTTFADDTEIAFPVLANTKYAFRIVAFYETVAAADFKYSIGGPAAPTVVRYHAREVEFGVARNDVEQTAFGVARSVATGAATSGKITIEGILHNGANAGSIRFRWAQNTSDAGATVVRAGSFIQGLRVQ